MTSTIISKGINKLSLNSLGPPTDEDFIRNIDYDELEKKFHVRKYYPQFIHNELATPNLKEMIADKPIYAKANDHLTKEQKREQIKELKRAYMREQKQIREQENLQRKREPVANRWCNGAATQRRASRPEQGTEDTRRPRQMPYEDVGVMNGQGPHDTTQHEYKSTIGNLKGYSRHHSKHDMGFRNPFDSNQSTLIENDPTTSAVKTHRQNSIAGKLMNFIKGRSDDESSDDNNLTLSKSYDQTKSSMTTTRKKPKSHSFKTKINELTNKKYTDNLGMYFLRIF
ncbi:DEHA2F08800p [Debaryomyces hansenii CBS767]|uniref:DEHA2F08800p n=1 Tax=Debaryomyces hansenii (strain ATCC 36239 / CBS 767 / BCRC 21394 / JCM 1990 / NBRC 0083 / IGC 2968) TaxID=284592 RepID=B5RUC7_DEBHA|nr:DEHA2F08800p [Debaryomyces hansenii CBS767]CAR66305.1 DEHA2F08800p [Debaryomyces hansenii CBS767]|eukprot:XP_002770780.1 DEHA2F08800p [Debaryomyces hansenii CBS767]